MFGRPIESTCTVMRMSRTSPVGRPDGKRRSGRTLESMVGGETLVDATGREAQPAPRAHTNAMPSHVDRIADVAEKGDGTYAGVRRRSLVDAR